MATLEKDMISQTELWKLALLIADDRLDVALFPPTPREEMIVRSFPFPSAAASPLRAIEDIIYENPLLFNDFKRVDCIIDNTPQILLPAAIDPDDLPLIHSLSTDTSSPAADAPLPEPMVFATADPDTIVTAVEPAEIEAFMRRTFYNVRFDSRIASLIRYFNSAAAIPDTPTIVGIIRDNTLTLLAFCNRSVRLANSFTFRSDADAAYYILATAATLGFDRDTVSLLISAPASPLADLLTPHFPNIAPIPFPMLRHRASKTTIQAPFELIIRPLCE